MANDSFMDHDIHTFIGKRCLGSSALDDFTNYQGIGHDPLYKRYESVQSVVRKVIDPKYANFLATPDFSTESDSIRWYLPEWREVPRRLTSLTGAERQRYEALKTENITAYRESLNNLSGEDLQVMAGALVGLDDEFMYCADGNIYALAWGMSPDTRKHISIGQLIHEESYIKKHTVTFDAGTDGVLTGVATNTLKITSGDTITANDIPVVNPNEGFEFAGWTPNPLGYKVESDVTFTAAYRPAAVAPAPVPTPVADPVIPAEPEPSPMATCRFNGGENGVVQGESVLVKPLGSTLTAAEIPKVKANKGYKFTGWSVNPVNLIVNGDKTFDAVYQRKRPWYSRWWIWLLTGLLALLLLLLLSWLFPDCSGCACFHEVDVLPDPIEGVIPGDGIHKKDPNGNEIKGPDGKPITDNGPIRDIPINDGKLPTEPIITPPVIGDDGKPAPIVSQPNVPGNPSIIANRLILFLEDENGDLDRLASDFKQAYPGAQYRIIGMDRNVKSLVIEIPENQRETMRENLPSQLTNQRFFVLDEHVMQMNGHQSKTTNAQRGWHLQAVGAREAWGITQGSPNVTVAIVDDGIDPSHSMFKGRIVKPYNVYLQSNQLSSGDGHGTHVAALAVGSTQYANNGAAGIAPNCKLMPVQVFDNEYCTASALVSGIMYAIHNGADVVNVSVGLPLEGLGDYFDDAEQLEIARTYFKDAEKLFERICTVAARKNVIIVFAAGNDSIISLIPPENRPNSLITVGAVNSRLQQTEFTNYGDGTDLSAPGEEIYSAFPVNSFRSEDGTSMAAPIVTGAVALMKSLNKNITVSQARSILYATGKPVQGKLPPMIQIPAALRMLQTGSIPSDVNNGQYGGIGDGGYAETYPPGGDVYVIDPGTGEIPGNGGGSHGYAGGAPGYGGGTPGSGTQPGYSGPSGGKPSPSDIVIYDPRTGSQVPVNPTHPNYDRIMQKIKELQGLLPYN